jgi:hypothetical protein
VNDSFRTPIALLLSCYSISIQHQIRNEKSTRPGTVRHRLLCSIASVNDLGLCKPNRYFLNISFIVLLNMALHSPRSSSLLISTLSKRAFSTCDGRRSEWMVIFPDNPGVVHLAIGQARRISLTQRKLDRRLQIRPKHSPNFVRHHKENFVSWAGMFVPKSWENPFSSHSRTSV